MNNELCVFLLFSAETNYEVQRVNLCGHIKGQSVFLWLAK
jgi:hypothetical protein